LEFAGAADIDDRGSLAEHAAGVVRGDLAGFLHDDDEDDDDGDDEQGFPVHGVRAVRVGVRAADTPDASRTPAESAIRKPGVHPVADPGSI